MRSSLLFAILALPASVACAQAHNPVTPDSGLSATVHAAAPTLRTLSNLRETIHLSIPEGPVQFKHDTDSSLVFTMGDGPANLTNLSLRKWSTLDVPADEVNAARNKTVAVKMIVNAAGEPQLLEVVQSVNPEVDRIALRTVKAYRFSPATIDRLPVSAPAIVQVSFGAN